MKEATLRFKWKASPSPGIVRQVVNISLDGGSPLEIDIPNPSVEAFEMDVKANTDIDFSVKAIKDDGQEATSLVFHFRLGDLEKPEPPTDLGIEIVNIHDAPSGSSRSGRR